MQGSRSRDSLKLIANTLTCFLSSSRRARQSADLTDGTDVGLLEDAGMGTPRFELVQTLSRAVGIPLDTFSKCPKPQDRPFPAQPAPWP